MCFFASIHNEDVCIHMIVAMHVSECCNVVATCILMVRLSTAQMKVVLLQLLLLMLNGVSIEIVLLLVYTYSTLMPYFSSF